MLSDVRGHTNILIHAGNYNNDSEGCILLGDSVIMSGRGQMITNSKVTFAKFMDLMKDQDSFFLMVQ